MPAAPHPWTAYEPTSREPWDRRKVAHLHRRAGFGVTAAEIERDLKDGPAASVERFLKPRPLTNEERLILRSLRRGLLNWVDVERLKAWWLYRILYDPDPLREKMTLFWHNHFATSNRKVRSVPLMLAQNDLLRKHALGSFADLANGIIRDEAMLLWLDGADNNKSRPNENFAREFLELFTLGVGHYTEADVRQAARAFTGFVKDESEDQRGNYQFRFEQDEFDGGLKTFLGQTGRWNAADIVRIVLQQPACAEFLCRKLYRFLVSEHTPPSDELIRPLAAKLRQQYSIGHVVGVILRSQHFYSQAAYRQRIQMPVEFSAGLLRSLQVPRGNVNLLALAAACERQGQELFYPPNVKGWEGGKSWLNSATLLERWNWTADVIWGNAELAMKPYAPAAGSTAASFLELLLQGDCAPRARALILQTADVRKALQIIVNCAEYQLG